MPSEGFDLFYERNGFYLGFADLIDFLFRDGNPKKADLIFTQTDLIYSGWTSYLYTRISHS